MKKVEILLGQILKEKKMTQGEFAKIAGLRPNAVSNLSRGYVDRLSIEHLEKIVNTLDLNDINEIITLKEVEDE
ncbi:helix-turn-helix domain-containing protein [Psychrobacillus sp. BM2]|uniref:helix-turn-helix domain-containing protein n=1 Tax=Psychrobacillus sp. BM2 TaxID=3400421 RepID=UPI003B023418